jgi:hypothetical protein
MFSSGTDNDVLTGAIRADTRRSVAVVANRIGKAFVTKRRGANRLGC